MLDTLGWHFKREHDCRTTFEGRLSMMKWHLHGEMPHAQETDNHVHNNLLHFPSSSTFFNEAYMLRQQPHPLKSQKDTTLFCANRISGAKQCQLGPTQIMPTWIHPNNANLDPPKQCQNELSQLEQKDSTSFNLILFQISIVLYL